VDALITVGGGDDDDDGYVHIPANTETTALSSTGQIGELSHDIDSQGVAA
jgi:hypothetical protein